MLFILRNGQFLLFDKKKNCFFVWHGDMLVKKGHIQPYFNQVKVPKNCQIIECSNKIIIPTFINVHLHLGETLYRPLPHKMSLLDYIKYTEDESEKHKNDINDLWKKSAIITINESLKYGTPIISTLRGNNFLSTYPTYSFCGYPIMLGKKLHHIYDAGFGAFKRYCKDCKNNVVPGVFLHSLYYNNKESFEFSKKCYKYCKTFYAIHVAEDEQSEELVNEKWGQRSVEILDKNNLLNSKTIIIHGNTLSNDELKLISKRKANIAICPVSAKNLNTKTKKPFQFEKYHINWCIATDGLASGESANLLLQTKELLGDINNFQSLFKAITINPQKALGLKNEILSKNSFANFIVIKKFKYNNVDELLYTILSNNIEIESVYFKGEKIVGGAN